MSESRKKKKEPKRNILELNVPKKNKKQIRFNIPEAKEEESDSESSINLIKEDKSECLINYENASVSIIKKFIYISPNSTVPRPIFVTPCRNQIVGKTISSVALPVAPRKTKETIPELNAKLLIATSLNQINAVKRAIRNGADVNISLNEQTPLLIATEGGNFRLVSYLLKVPKINLNVKDSLGRTPLLLALGDGNEGIAKMLLKHKADVNLSDNMGKTALHWALYNQRTYMVKLLLAYGADYEKPDCFGEKPMYTSTVKKPNLELLKALLKMGASPEYVTTSGVPLLSRTILNGTDFRIIETLVKYGASVNSQDITSKKTPLHFAALMDNLKVAEFLVNVGADVNLQTTYNFTPLDEANAQRSANVASYLLDMKALKNYYDDSVT